jgi:nucleoporin POM152
MCKAAVTDLKFAVHALPSAQVGNGKRIQQDILEGNLHGNSSLKSNQKYFV